MEDREREIKTDIEIREPRVLSENVQRKYFLIIIALIIIAVIISGFILYSFSSSIDSPEQTLHSWNERINKGDAKGALDLTIRFFADHATYLFHLKYLEGLMHISEVYHIFVENIIVLHEDELGSSLKEYMEDQLDYYLNNFHYHIDQEDVEGYCFLYYTQTAFIDEEFETDYIMMPCILIDSSWYLMTSF